MASERLTDRDLSRLDKPGIGDDVRMMAREIIQRRAAEVELHNRANKCRDYSRRFGVYKTADITALLDLIDRLGEGGER